MSVQLAVLCIVAGATCVAGSVICIHIGAVLNGMTANSYMVERDGRYLAIGRGTEQRVLKEITPQEFRNRNRYRRIARVLSVTGLVLGMGGTFFLIGTKLLATRQG